MDKERLLSLMVNAKLAQPLRELKMVGPDAALTSATLGKGWQKMEHANTVQLDQQLWMADAWLPPAGTVREL